MAAGNAVIGALRVVLGADSAALEKGFKDARDSAGKFASGLSSTLKVATAAMASAAGVMAIAIKGALNEADDLGKMAQKIGVPIEELSGLKYAADLSGVSIESLEKGLGRLSRNLVEGAQGLQTPVRAFQALGIEIRNADGSIKTVGQALPELADKFTKMRDGPEKTALSMQLLGRAGADLIPLLNSGAAGIKQMTDEAAELGLIIDDKTYRAAEAFNDNLTRMSRIFKGIVTQVTAEMAPAFYKLSEDLLSVGKNSDFAKTSADGLVTVIKGAISVALTAGLTFQRLGAEVNALWQVLMAPDWASMKAAWSNYLAAGEETKTRFAGLKDYLGKFWSDVGKLPETMSKPAAASAPTIIKTTKDALESFIASQYKHIAATNAQAQSVGLSTAEQERMKVTAQAIATAQQANIPITAAMTQKITELGNAAYAAQLKLQGAQLTQQVMTPAEQYQQKLALQQQLFDAGVISAETYGRAQRQASVEAGTAWDIAGASIAGSFQQIAGAFGKQSKTMATIAKAAGIVQATISMFTGAAKALELPFPANLAAMATVLGQGASLVASIKGTQVPKFATGGSMKIGGVGGIDSQRVAFDASPGEIVEVKKNPYGGASSEGGGFREIRVRDLNLRPVWSLDNVRDLIDRINDAVGDGARLKIVTA